MNFTTLKALLRRPFLARALRRERLFERTIKHELAVCGIFKDEAPFLDEWIRFHIGVGVGRCYLYNNFSSDEFQQILEPWIRKGFVTLTEWPRMGEQISAFQHCIRKRYTDARWIAFIDIDEFLFSPEKVDIRPILGRFRHLPGIEVWPLFFGSSGHRTRPATSQLEAFTRGGHLSPSRDFKSIVNPRLAFRASIHRCKYWQGRSLDTLGKKIDTGGRPVFSPLRIHHYWSRSLEDLEFKMVRGDGESGRPTTAHRDWFINFERGLNAIEDLTIIPIWREIQRRAPWDAQSAA